MTKSVEFFFDVVSPASYLAWTQMPKLAKETGAEIIYRPFFLPGVFEKAGSSTPITIPNKGKWVFRDLNRWAKKYDVPFNMNDRFPLSSVYAMRGLNNFRDGQAVRALGDGFFDAMWVNNQDINDPAIVTKICSDAGIDPLEYQEKLQDPANKKALIEVTKEAVERGVFGAPTFFVGKMMHWGQDRLDFVREDAMA
ncbi:MAG: 2-hydroxychromene-2-carboxylate isomerase [Pseudomonadota bacterium]